MWSRHADVGNDERAESRWVCVRAARPIYAAAPLDRGERMKHPAAVEQPPSGARPAAHGAIRWWSTSPTKRLAFLFLTGLACVVHFYFAILFHDGPTPVSAWILNGVMFSLIVIAIALLITLWSMRGAAIVAVVGVGYVAAFTAFLVHVYRPLRG